MRRNRDFLLLWCGQTVSVLGSRASSVAFPLLVLNETQSAGKAGVAGFVATLPYLLFFLPSGVVVDRCDRRRLMFLCEASRAVALGSIPAALFLDRLTFGQILLVGFVEGTAFVFFSVAEKASLPMIVPAAQIPGALSVNEARDRAAGWVGRTLGGWMFSLSRSVPFLVDAVSYAVSLLTLAAIRSRLGPQREDRSGTPLHELAEGMRFLWRQPFIRLSVLLVGIVNIVFEALTLVLIVLMRDRGDSGGVIGLVLGCLGAGGMAGAFAAPSFQRRARPGTIVIGATWGWTALLVLQFTFSHPLALSALVFMMAFVGTLWNVVVVSYQYTIIPARLLGRVKSGILLVAWGTIPLGSIVAGWLVESMGAEPTLAALAATMLCVAILATSSSTVRSASK
nr:MFS transporter [Actinomadura rayongensis]